LIKKKKKIDFIEKERFSLYMNEMLRNYIGSILIGLPLYYFIFQAQVSTNMAKIWFACDAVLLISVFLTYYVFYKHKDYLSLTTLQKISDIPVVIFSLHIAIAPWLWLQSEVNIYLYTMFIMIISLTGTVTHAISYYFERLFVFSTIPILSLAIKFYTIDTNRSFEAYILVILVWIGLITFARRIHESLINSIVLTFENIQARSNAELINTEKSQFFAAASHDIRQPLQAVNLLVSSLKSKNTNPDNDLLLERLESSVDSMSELLNSLLDVSKLDAHVIVPHPEHICLTTLLERLHTELKPLLVLKGLNLQIHTKSEIVIADTILLEQVLNNLLSNAIRYTSTGSINLSTQLDSEKIIISVEDTGIGIAKADQESIFLEFFQLHNPERDSKKGLGLGLSIIKRLCALQNWPLTLTSDLGVGSCFSFKVPQGKRELIQIINKVNINKNLDGVNVIIIDDHEGIRFSLTNMLNEWGCMVRSFESATAACNALDNFPTWNPNLIISDYRLINNKTGVEAVEQVQAKRSYPIEAIIITGDTEPNKIKEIEKMDLMVLHKPIKPAQLRVVISRKMKSTLESM
jgi:signal transduction histidine kinase/CheY-like chemotaxis protein